MPIVSRTLIPLSAGWRVDGLDSAGRRWTHILLGGTQTEAEAIAASCWPDAMLLDADEADGIKYVENGGTPDTYAPSDMTVAEWRRRVALRFWRGTLETDRAFMIRAAAYIAQFTAAQIANALGVSEAKAQTGLDRAIAIRDSIGPALEASDAQAEDLG